MVIKVATLQEAADIKTMMESNKATMEKIAKEIFPQAVKLIDSIAKKYSLKYLVDKQYKLESYQDCYVYNIKEDGYDFGRFNLFTITQSKICDDPGDFDWNHWEDAVFELCREVNKLEVAKKYGESYTEQPDDGDQVNFYVKHSLLLTPDDLEQQKKELEEERKREYERQKQEQKEMEEKWAKIRKLIPKYFNEMKKEAVDASNSFCNAVKKDFSSANKEFGAKLQFGVVTGKDPWSICASFIYFKTDILNKKDPVISKAMKDLVSCARKNEKILKGLPASCRLYISRAYLNINDSDHNVPNNSVYIYCVFGIDSERWLRNHNLLESSLIEELNKKSSIKENADMVIDVNPINEGLFKKKDMSPLEIIEDMYKKFKAWWNKPHTLESFPGQKRSGITSGADLADALTYDSFQIAEAYGITESQIATRFIERAPKYTTIINQENYKKMYADQGFNVPKMEAILKSEDLYNIAWDGDDFVKYVSSKTKKVYEAHESEGNENSFKPSKIYEGFHYKIDKEALKEFDTKYGFYKFSKCPDGETKKSFIDSLEGKFSVKESTDIVDAIDESTDIITRREFMMYRKIIKNCLSKYPSIKAASFIPENYNGVVTVPAKKYDYASKNSYDFTVGHLIVSDVDKSEKSKCYADIKSELESYNSPFNIKLSIKSRKENGETIDSFVVRVSDKKPVKESVEESITEGFGIDKSQKASLSDLELSYDRKFNAFCLSVSSYSPEKLKNTLAQKQNALTDAQKEKKDAKDRYAKLATQLKIDYLKNTIEKTNTLIKRKSKAEAQSAVVTPRKKVSESVEVLNELFGKRWKPDKNARTESPKPPEPKRKYANLTKEEFEKCMSIIKTNVGKYPRLKKVINYDHNGCYSTYQKYIDFDEDEVVVAFLEWGEYDNEIKDEDKLDKFLNELDKDQDKCYASISKEFSQLSFKVEFETVPDAEFDCLCINSRKPLESTNEGFFEQKRDEDQKIIAESQLSKYKNVKIENESDKNDAFANRVLNKLAHVFLNDAKDLIDDLYIEWYKNQGSDMTKNDVIKLAEELFDLFTIKNSKEQGLYDVTMWINCYHNNKNSSKFFEGHSMYNYYQIRGKDLVIVERDSMTL